MSNLLLKIILSLNIVKNIIFNRYSKYPKYVIDFEKKLADKFSSKYALSFSNGTQAFEASLLSLGLEKGSKILLSKLTFTSTCITILKNGFQPVYLDFDKNLKMILDEDILKKDISAIVVTHAFGYTNETYNVKKIKELKPKVKIIADCSHAHGAKFNNESILNFADISFMSLQGAKAISAGEGGIIFTNSKDLLNTMIQLSHPSRQLIDKENLYLNIPGFSKFGKSRIHPIGAILASNDLENLNRKNTLLKLKLNLIYSILKNNKYLYLPTIDVENTGGYHYGIPFFIKKVYFKNEYKKIPIKKYNYLKYDRYHEFSNPENYYKFIVSNDKLIEDLKIESNTNDIRDELYFFDLDWLKKIKIHNLRKEISDFSSFLENQ